MQDKSLIQKLRNASASTNMTTSNSQGESAIRLAFVSSGRTLRKVGSKTVATPNARADRETSILICRSVCSSPFLKHKKRSKLRQRLLLLRLRAILPTVPRTSKKEIAGNYDAITARAVGSALQNAAESIRKLTPSVLKRKGASWMRIRS